MPERSRWARGMILTRYAMRGFEVRKEFRGVAAQPGPRLSQSLADSFASVSMGGDIKKPLIRFRILHNRCSLALNGQDDRPLIFFEQLHELPGVSPKGRHR